MRKPCNRNKFRLSDPHDPPQSMLYRRSRLRYDPPLTWERPPSASACDSDATTQEVDMDVTGAGAVGGAAPIRPTQLSAPDGVEAPLSGGLVAPQDEVQISSAARALGQIDPGLQIHEARLAEIRAAIADGTYETPEKLEAAVERLLASLNSSHR